VSAYNIAAFCCNSHVQENLPSANRFTSRKKHSWLSEFRVSLQNFGCHFDTQKQLKKTLHTWFDGTDETLVFVDLEAAGLPKENRLITELCMISISQRDLVQRNISNVIDNCDKLVFVIDPKHSITATAQSINHLTQATIMRSEKQPINKDVIQVIEDYMKRHRKPICVLSHGGICFDFDVMRSRFRDFSDVSSPIRGCKCADTLPAFRTLSRMRLRRQRNGLDAIYERCVPSDVRQDTHQEESDVSLMKVVRFQLSVLALLNKALFM